MRFLVGDELGNVKSLRHAGPLAKREPNDVTAQVRTVYEAEAGSGKSKAIEKLAICRQQSDSSAMVRVIYEKTSYLVLNSWNEGQVAAALSDGTAFLAQLPDDDEPLKLLNQWKESRLKAGQSYVGLALTRKYVFVAV